MPFVTMITRQFQLSTATVDPPEDLHKDISYIREREGKVL